MTEINRRTILGAAGASIALAACSEDSVNATKNSKSAFSPLGGPGDENEVPPSVVNNRERPKGYNGDFKPKHDFLVYLKFENSRLTIRSMFLDNAGIDEKASRQRAATSFADVTNWKNTPGNGYREDFNDFGFATQTRLYFHVGNSVSDAKFDSINKIVMAAYFAKDGNKDKTKKLKPNNSFLNDELIIVGGKEYLVVENWYVDEQGKEIDEARGNVPPAKKIGFSMNVHLMISCSSPTSPIYIPIVVDPDGTNGIRKP